MSIRSIGTAVMLTLAATVAHAQMPALTVKAGVARMATGSNLVSGDLDQTFRTSMSDESSITAGVVVSEGGLSVELSISRFEPDTTFRSSGQVNDLGGVEVVPVTATVNYDFARFGSLVPYIGAGLGYVRFGDVDGDVSGLRLEDDVTWAATAGIHYSPGRRLLLGVDAKYIGAESEFIAPGRDPLPIEFEPLILSLTVGYRFAR